MKNLFYFVLDQEVQYCISHALSVGRAYRSAASKKSKRLRTGQAEKGYGAGYRKRSKKERNYDLKQKTLFRF